MGVSPAMAPDEAAYVTLDFEKGWPVAIDGEKMKASDIIRRLNDLGGKNGIGLLDIVENRLVGMKDRGVYETPGGTILYKAHQILETICLDKLTAHKKQELRMSLTMAALSYRIFSLSGSVLNPAIHSADFSFRIPNSSPVKKNPGTNTIQNQHPIFM